MNQDTHTKPAPAIDAPDFSGEPADAQDTSLSEDGRQLAFIVGHYKSGSTWLENLLSLHPAVRGVAETHIFRYVLRATNFHTATARLYSETHWGSGEVSRLLRHYLAELSRPLRSILKPKLPPHDRPTTSRDLGLIAQYQLKRSLYRSVSPEDFCRRFFQFLHKKLKPRRYLLEKSPTSILLTPFIREVFPNAKLMAIHRDGRDVVVSERFFLASEGKPRRSFEDSVLAWREAMQAELDYADKYDIFVCSYRSLSENGESTLRELLHFLGLPLVNETMHDMLRRSSFKFTTGRERGQEDPHSFYRKGMPGDWVNHLTPEEKRQFKELAGDMLVRLGYEKDLDW